LRGGKTFGEKVAGYVKKAGGTFIGVAIGRGLLSQLTGEKMRVQRRGMCGRTLETEESREEVVPGSKSRTDYNTGKERKKKGDPQIRQRCWSDIIGVRRKRPRQVKGETIMKPGKLGVRSWVDIYRRGRKMKSPLKNMCTSQKRTLLCWRRKRKQKRGGTSEPSKWPRGAPRTPKITRRPKEEEKESRRGGGGEKMKGFGVDR